MARRRGIWGVIAFALVASAAPAMATSGFGDVGHDRFYAAPVQWMVDEDITQGTSEFCFSPDGLVTRGQVAAFIFRMEDPDPGYAPHTFVDVTATWQQDPISWMAAEGITTGTSETTFSPGQNLTRGQLAAMLWRLAGRPESDAPLFPDVVKNWQMAPVRWMVEQGITTGTSDTTFSPERFITRGEVATFLYRYKGSPETLVDPTHPSEEPCDLQVPAQPYTLCEPVPEEIAMPSCADMLAELHQMQIVWPRGEPYFTPEHEFTFPETQVLPAIISPGRPGTTVNRDPYADYVVPPQHTAGIGLGVRYESPLSPRLGYYPVGGVRLDTDTIPTLPFDPADPSGSSTSSIDIDQWAGTWRAVEVRLTFLVCPFWLDPDLPSPDCYERYVTRPLLDGEGPWSITVPG